MWSEPAGVAARVTDVTGVSSFWDAAPVASAAPVPTTHFVQAQAPQAIPDAPVQQEEEAESRPSFAELEREAFMKGYAQGERAGGEAAARRGEAMLRRLAQTVEELAGLRTELVHKTERQVVELALAIAGRILRREVAVDRELLVTMARVALERLGENTAATIRLNPDDYTIVGATAQLGGNAVLRIVADPLVSSGGCLVQSDFGLIDVGVDAQLGEMARALGVAHDVPAESRRGAA